MEPFIGQVMSFAGNFAPRGWAFCDGQLLSINQNQALFSILGTTYGGDGRTSFALPDLRGRDSIHPGSGPGLSTYKLGQRGGRETITLTVNELPNHNHTPGTLKGTMMVNEDDGTSAEPKGLNMGLATQGLVFNADDAEEAMSPNNVTVSSGATGNTGGQIPFQILKPFLGINHIIAMQGTFPSRS